MKTLKDIEEELDKCTKVVFHFEAFRELKEEAIKDIKEFEKQKTSEWTFLFNPTKEEIDAIIQYIKWKNNLTEEDLK